MQTNQEDNLLAERIVNGDSEAENILFLRFRERIELLVSVRLRRKVHPDEQKDILSEIYQAVLLSLRKGYFNSDTEKPLEAYIAGITSNVVGQYFRRQKREPEIRNIDYYQKIENHGNILSDLIDEEKRMRIKACLKRIKPKYLEIIVLRFYENKSIEEIAEHLNLEKRRVSERINYALKLLLKEINTDNYFQ